MIIQGLAEMQLPAERLRPLFAEIADNAAFGSIVLGELPGLPKQMAEVSNGTAAPQGLLPP